MHTSVVALVPVQEFPAGQSASEVQAEPAGKGLALKQKLAPVELELQLKPAGQERKGVRGDCGCAGSQILAHTLTPGMLTV